MRENDKFSTRQIISNDTRGAKVYLSLKLFDLVAILLGFNLLLFNFSSQLSIFLGQLNNLGGSYGSCHT